MKNLDLLYIRRIAEHYSLIVTESQKDGEPFIEIRGKTVEDFYCNSDDSFDSFLDILGEYIYDRGYEEGYSDNN